MISAMQVTNLASLPRIHVPQQCFAKNRNFGASRPPSCAPLVLGVPRSKRSLTAQAVVDKPKPWEKKKKQSAQTQGNTKGATSSKGPPVKKSEPLGTSGPAGLLETAMVVDEGTGRELECVVHKRFNVQGKGTLCLLEPLDIPVQVLRGEGAPDEDMGDLSDSELDDILDDMKRALAKRRLRLYRSAYCLTVRGALRYFDGDVVVLDEGSGLESEGVEICTFSSQGSFYMLYTPVEPLLLAARQVEGASGLTFVESDLQDSAVQRQLLSLQLTLDQDDEEDEG